MYKVQYKKISFTKYLLKFDKFFAFLVSIIKFILPYKHMIIYRISSSKIN